jgi:hypothetical protein
MTEGKITRATEDDAIQHVESRGDELKPGQVALKSLNDNLGLWATVVKFRKVSKTNNHIVPGKYLLTILSDVGCDYLQPAVYRSRRRWIPD